MCGCIAGQPAAAVTPAIQPGVNTLTVTWTGPTTADTASAYVVTIYTDGGTAAANAVHTSIALPWNDDPDNAQLQYDSTSKAYTYTTPTLTGVAGGEKEI